MDENAFSHALYNYVAHWASYGATVTLLATLGIVLSASTITVSHQRTCIFGIILGLLSSWYFL